MTNQRFFRVLAALFGLWWIALAIAPLDRQVWVLQNVGIVGACFGLAVARKRIAFSRIWYAYLFVFLCLAEVGAHYTYPKTPYDA